MTVAQKIWTKQRRKKKMRLIKMTVTKKIGTRQLKTKKWHPIKMTVAKKNWATVQDKTMQFIKWLLPKKRSQTVEKTGTL